MNMKEYCHVAVIALFFMTFIMGCSWLKSYGKLRIQSGPGKKVAIEELIEQWQSYDVYYAGLSLENPSAIMFDPKGDGQKLVSDKWIAVKNRQELSTLVNWIDANIPFSPVLWRVLGPDSQFYGYMYSAWNHVLIKVVDESTLWVDDLPLPPTDYGPAGDLK